MRGFTCGRRNGDCQRERMGSMAWSSAEFGVQIIGLETCVAALIGCGVVLAISGGGTD